VFGEKEEAVDKFDEAHEELKRPGGDVFGEKEEAVDKFDEAHEELKARGLVEE